MAGHGEVLSGFQCAVVWQGMPLQWLAERLELAMDPTVVQNRLLLMNLADSRWLPIAVVCIVIAAVVFIIMMIAVVVVAIIVMPVVMMIAVVVVTIIVMPVVMMIVVVMVTIIVMPVVMMGYITHQGPGGRHAEAVPQPAGQAIGKLLPGRYRDRGW